MRHTIFVLIVLTAGAASLRADQGPLPWTQLSKSTCGVEKYERDHPELDGRGVVVAILDTGVDMGVLGLTHTPLGEVKVIDVQDFTGQGDIELQKIEFDADTGKFIHYAEDGAPEEYTFSTNERFDLGTTFWFGSIDESRFANSSAVARPTPTAEPVTIAFLPESCILLLLPNASPECPMSRQYYRRGARSRQAQPATS